MNVKLSRFLSGVGAVLFLLGGGTFGATDAMADDKYRKEYRRHDGQAVRAAAVNRDIRTHERERRAFVAGAAVQQHRNDNRNYYRGGGGYGYRDGYADRYRDRYYDDHDDHDDNKIGAALVGAAVGAVVTGVVMSNMNKDSDNNSSNNNRQ